MSMQMCQASNCPNGVAVKKHGLCLTHYSRMQRKGTVDDAAPIRAYNNEGCEVVGCDAPHRSKGLCQKHYMRFKRTGSTSLKHSPPRDHKGYLEFRSKGHPMANEGGRVRVHRAVLFAVIGYGPHRCHWCSVAVTWKVDLHVDHLDWDTKNNKPSNLVPSCPSCNSKRRQGNSTFPMTPTR